MVGCSIHSRLCWILPGIQCGTAVGSSYSHAFLGLVVVTLCSLAIFSALLTTELLVLTTLLASFGCNFPLVHSMFVAMLAMNGVPLISLWCNPPVPYYGWP